MSMVRFEARCERECVFTEQLLLMAMKFAPWTFHGGIRLKVAQKVFSPTQGSITGKNASADDERMERNLCWAIIIKFLAVRGADARKYVTTACTYYSLAYQ